MVAVLSEETATILIVDDDPVVIQVIGHMIAPLGQVDFATSGSEALALMRLSAPDVVLLDAEMPGISGTHLCCMIKEDPALEHIPVIFVTSNTQPEFEVRCFRLGAVDYVQKPVHAPVLLARLQTHIRLKQLSDRLRHSASIDPLTEIANRRAFDSALVHEWRRAVRNREALSLLLVDLDHFKAFNDHYGHPAGDDCLRVLALTLTKIAVRGTDLAARYGGEEFAVLLPGTNAAGAQAVADRLLSLLAEQAIPHARSPVGAHVTASIGIATYQPQSVPTAHRSEPPRAAMPAGPRDLLSLADEALYEAKHRGRSRTSAKPLLDPEARHGAR
jgi:diguanylate cyclase (GGDEF)-like protein